MILTGNGIRNAIGQKKILITPFNDNHINPNSYDISIGKTISYYHDNKTLDMKIESKYITKKIPKSGFVLKKNKFYFAMSKEKIQTEYFVPLLHNRSGVARKGLFTHITADLLQINHNGHVLIQLFALSDTIICPEQIVSQISFWKTI